MKVDIRKAEEFNLWMKKMVNFYYANDKLMNRAFKKLYTKIL